MKNYHFVLNDEEYRPIYYINLKKEVIYLKNYAISIKGKVFNLNSRRFEIPVRSSGTYCYTLDNEEYSVRGLLKYIWKIRTKEERLTILNKLLREYDIKQSLNVILQEEQSLKFYGNRLKLLMDFKKIAIEELANELSIPVNNLRQYTASIKNPNSIIIARLATFFNIDRAFFQNDDWDLKLTLTFNKNKYDIFYNEQTNP